MYTGAFPPQSNRADWVFAVEVVNAEDESAVDLTGCTINLAVSDQKNKCTLFIGSTTGDYVTISTPETDGIFVVNVPASVLEDLEDGKFYNVGIRITYSGGEIVQLIRAPLPIVEGIE